MLVFSCLPQEPKVNTQLVNVSDIKCILDPSFPFLTQYTSRNAFIVTCITCLDFGHGSKKYYPNKIAIQNKTYCPYICLFHAHPTITKIKTPSLISFSPCLYCYKFPSTFVIFGNMLRFVLEPLGYFWQVR